MMLKIYGCSDDLVEIDGTKYKHDEIGCFDHDVRIRFTDGTVIRVGYPKDGLAVWWIEVEKQGTAEQHSPFAWTKMPEFIVMFSRLPQR